MAPIDSSDTAKRVRAALAYAGIDVKESKEKTGVTYATMQRIVSPTNPRGASLDELRQIADHCPGVPRWFLEYGFAPPVETGETDLRQEVSDTRAELASLSRTVASLSQQLQAIRDQGLQPGSKRGGQQ